MAIVTKTLEANPARMKESSEIKDEEIDFSDIPKLTENDFKAATPVQEFLTARKTKDESAIVNQFNHWFDTQDKSTQKTVKNILLNIMKLNTH
ncbi:hypothetical protein [Acinetobacter nectaris]|uniref:hypothetical protein n=1 Tax=Acinetobacter nectaris TaxID=1219382 RepID=UPI001F333B13|nr:hypothetical protein [Acinetobacter nectaris]MCF9000250.1 hypothetical protein [Acinetobacter nectaris]MCF9028553.1 hypothetical protein [Acinetobacter nectaris]